jgi:hypothetical protein
MFTNLIFESEKKAIEFKNQQKSMRKAHDCRAVPYMYNYFNGVSNLDHLNGSEKPQDS